MNKVILLILVTALPACGPSQPSETVDALVANPERIKEIQRQCKEDRAKVGDELCLRAAEAAKRRFFGDRPEQNPSRLSLGRFAATKFSLLPHYAAMRSRLRRFYCFRH
jgi:hypothetical protein